jgi:hypothetical protein
MRNYTSAQRLVAKMLRENTGKHFLDSGGAYGRNFERNKAKTIRDFANEPEESYTYDGNYLYRTVSVYHFLSKLELDKLAVEFNKRNVREDNWNANADVYGVGEKTWEWLTNRNDVEVERTFNTYNGDSDLSQIIQGSYLKINGDGYYLIQIHGGCDARGGYTDARLFKCANYDEVIHEYLQEYKDSYEIDADLEEGYIDNVRDYYGSDKVYTSNEILNTINQ